MKGAEYTYWKFEKALDDEMCQRILDLGLKNFKQAGIKEDGKDVFNKDIRESSIVWLNEQWLFDLVFSNYKKSHCIPKGRFVKQ